MIDLTPPLFKQGSSLDLHIVAPVFDNIMKRPVNSIRFNVDQLFIVNPGISVSPVNLWPFGNVKMLRILVKIPDTILYIVLRIIFKHRCNIIMKINPVLPVQKKYADSDQIGNILVIISPVNMIKSPRVLAALADDLFQQMARAFRAVTIGMDSRPFDIIEVIIYKLLSDSP